jgi:hypothetical protein
LCAAAIWRGRVLRHANMADVSSGNHLDIEVIYPTAMALSFQRLNIDLEGTLQIPT